jgi:hypothetical protein
MSDLAEEKCSSKENYEYWLNSLPLDMYGPVWRHMGLPESRRAEIIKQDTYGRVGDSPLWGHIKAELEAQHFAHINATNK